MQVLESFLETCVAMVSAGHDDSGMERLAKATVLGWLLPALLTSLTHPQLYSLNLADALMPSLVRLILLSSQVSCLFRHQNTRKVRKKLLGCQQSTFVSDFFFNALYVLGKNVGGEGSSEVLADQCQIGEICCFVGKFFDFFFFWGGGGRLQAYMNTVWW